MADFRRIFTDPTHCGTAAVKLILRLPWLVQSTLTLIRFTPATGEFAANHHLRLYVAPDAVGLSLQPADVLEVQVAISAARLAVFIDLSSSSRAWATLIAAARK